MRSGRGFNGRLRRVLIGTAAVLVLGAATGTAGAEEPVGPAATFSHVAADSAADEDPADQPASVHTTGDPDATSGPVADGDEVPDTAPDSDPADETDASPVTTEPADLPEPPAEDEHAAPSTEAVVTPAASVEPSVESDPAGDAPALPVTIDLSENSPVLPPGGSASVAAVPSGVPLPGASGTAVSLPPVGDSGALGDPAVGSTAPVAPSAVLPATGVPTTGLPAAVVPSTKAPATAGTKVAQLSLTGTPTQVLLPIGFLSLGVGSLLLLFARRMNRKPNHG